MADRFKQMIKRELFIVGQYPLSSQFEGSLSTFTGPLWAPRPNQGEKESGQR